MTENWGADSMIDNPTGDLIIEQVNENPTTGYDLDPKSMMVCVMNLREKNSSSKKSNQINL